MSLVGTSEQAEWRVRWSVRIPEEYSKQLDLERLELLGRDKRETLSTCMHGLMLPKASDVIQGSDDQSEQLQRDS